MYFVLEALGLGTFQGKRMLEQAGFENANRRCRDNR